MKVGPAQPLGPWTHPGAEIKGPKHRSGLGVPGSPASWLAAGKASVVSRSSRLPEFFVVALFFDGV